MQSVQSQKTRLLENFGLESRPTRNVSYIRHSVTDSERFLASTPNETVSLAKLGQLPQEQR